MTSAEKLRRFRLATINLHSFRKPTDRTINIDDLVSILKPLDLDLIAVEEIQKNNRWKKFCEEMSFAYSIYGAWNGNTGGNGITSSYPISSYSNQQSSIICQGGTRSFLQCSIDGLEKLTFAVTHLDHLDEDVRLAQLNEFDPHKQNIDILMGDMNALTREDYSDYYYQHTILDIREKSSWEKPRFHLTKLLRDQWKYEDAFRLINPHLKDEQVATSRFGTRIDYIYIHPRITNRWELTKCEIIDTKGVTDHNVVLAELTQISK